MFTLDDGEDGSFDDGDDLNPVIKPRSATMDRQRETNDRDLIEALAQAELEDGDSGLAAGGGGVDDSALNVNGADVEAEGIALLAPTTTFSSPSQAGVAKELEELAALEKELGLDPPLSTEGGSGAGEVAREIAGGTGGDEEEDDLDDLEKYLNSIQ